MKYMFAALLRSANADLCELRSHNIYYKNRTPLSKSKIWTAERTLKYMFAALRRSASADYENTVLITYIIVLFSGIVKKKPENKRLIIFVV